MTDEYLRRNLVCAKAYGVRAGIGYAINRISQHRSNIPQWLVEILNREHNKMQDICDETAKHRDEVKP